MKRLAVLLAAVVVISCNRNCGPGGGQPTPTPTCVPCCFAPPGPSGTPTAEPTATETRRPLPTRTPTATATRTPKPTKTATRTATPTPTRGPVRIDDVACAATASDGIYKYVKEAILAYRDEHADIMTGDNLPPAYWDSYYFDIVQRLNVGGHVEAVVDDCVTGICGEIAVKHYGTVRGQGAHEQFHILTSSGDLRYQTDCYRATCTPSGF